MRFILAVISGDIVVSNRRRAAIETDLVDQGFERMPNTKKVRCCPRTYSARHQS